MDPALVPAANRLQRTLTADLINDTLANRPSPEELQRDGVLRGKPTEHPPTRRYPALFYLSHGPAFAMGHYADVDMPSNSSVGSLCVWWCVYGGVYVCGWVVQRTTTRWPRRCTAAPRRSRRRCDGTRSRRR